MLVPEMQVHNGGTTLNAGSIGERNDVGCMAQLDPQQSFDVGFKFSNPAYASQNCVCCFDQGSEPTEHGFARGMGAQVCWPTLHRNPATLSSRKCRCSEAHQPLASTHACCRSSAFVSGAGRQT